MHRPRRRGARPPLLALLLAALLLLLAARGAAAQGKRRVPRRPSPPVRPAGALGTHRKSGAHLGAAATRRGSRRCDPRRRGGRRGFAPEPRRGVRAPRALLPRRPAAVVSADSLEGLG